MSTNVIKIIEDYLGYFVCLLLTLVCKLGSFLLPSITKPPKKIVFVKFIEQGALVLHINTFKKAIQQLGEKNVYIVTFSNNVEFLNVLEIFDQENIISIKSSNLWSFTLDFIRSVFQLRRQEVDSAVDLEFFSRASAIFCFLSGAVNRVGYHRFSGKQNYRGNLFTHKLNYSHYLHVADSGLFMLNALLENCNYLPAYGNKISQNEINYRFVPAQEDIEWYNLFASKVNYSESKTIIVNPGFIDMLPLRKWDTENYIELVNLLLQKFPTVRIIITGRQDEMAQSERFEERLTDKTRVINFCGKTSVRQLLTLYSRASLLIATDSGVAHFASITSIFSVVLFGPETPVLYQPLTRNSKVIYKNLPCSPCYNVYNNRVSPCRDNLCLKTITVTEVFAAVLKVIDS